MLRFEKFTEDHIPLYYSWRNDPEVAQFDQSGFIRPMSYNEVAEWSQIMVDGQTFVAYDDDIALGTCAFMNLDQRNGHAELAIVIGNKDYWSQGFGTKIMKQLLEWGFYGLNLNRLYLHVFSTNTRAIGLYEKMGFVKEGEMREMLFQHGKPVNLICYGMLRNEYIKKYTE
ncbi:GNAT family N-acetyltransferase [Erysipelothrix urinaevulpis]|uniref:GNAT family N-acetyltransferase n=1 Tax=Erysipelothrix urinaevulpis TaxID=2683717 RepID=UPI001356D0E3|nr:GNAT family protein [Erysipelothrix urinaevulpis]